MSLVRFLTELRGEIISIETKKGTIIQGCVENCDDSMNLVLSNVTVIRKIKNIRVTSRLDTVHVRGTSVCFIILPENIADVMTNDQVDGHSQGPAQRRDASDDSDPASESDDNSDTDDSQGEFHNRLNFLPRGAVTNRGRGFIRGGRGFLLNGMRASGQGRGEEVLLGRGNVLHVEEWVSPRRGGIGNLRNGEGANGHDQGEENGDVREDAQELNAIEGAGPGRRGRGFLQNGAREYGRAYPWALHVEEWIVQGPLGNLQNRGRAGGHAQAGEDGGIGNAPGFNVVEWVVRRHGDRGNLQNEEGVRGGGQADDDASPGNDLHVEEWVAPGNPYHVDQGILQNEGEVRGRAGRTVRSIARCANSIRPGYGRRGNHSRQNGESSNGRGNDGDGRVRDDNALSNLGNGEGVSGQGHGDENQADRGRAHGRGGGSG